jgi:hypothetical protein
MVWMTTLGWEQYSMSTVNVDDQLYLRTREIAREQGKSVDEFVSDVLQQTVGPIVPQQTLVHLATRNGLPVMIVNGLAPSIDPLTVRRIIEEEGF